MKRFVMICAVALLPCIAFTSVCAQQELPRYELPHEEALYYELDDSESPGENYEPKERKYPRLWITATVFIVVFIMLVGLLMIATIHHAADNPA